MGDNLNINYSRKLRYEIRKMIQMCLWRASLNCVVSYPILLCDILG